MRTARRHGESEYNAQGRFIGWADPGLTQRGEDEARRAAAALRDHGFGDCVDELWTSYLRRSIKTGWLIASELDRAHMPVTADWRLNEQM
jgi:2,3-bisphosphoglycerate-dependent phosphoglycerate mutase